MPSESSPLLQAQASAPGNSQVLSQTAGRSSPNSPDPDSHPKSIAEDGKAGGSQNVLTVIPLLLVGVFISNGDFSLVLATNGAIASEFKDLEHSGWLLTGFMLAMCATQPLYGKMSDVYGRKLMLSVAYVLFIVGCFVSGIGSTMGQVIYGGIVSGAGGAGMTALVSIVIADMVPLRDVAAWRSYVNIAATTGRSLGGPLGGYLTDSIGWRWSFYGQCPPLLLALALVVWRLPPSPSTRRSGQDDSESPSRESSRLARIDFLGAILLAGTIITFLLILDLGTKRDSAPKVSVLAVLVVVLCGFLVWVEKRWAREPIFPLSLLANRDVVTSYLIAALQVAAQSGVMFSIPIYFQITENASVAAAGSRLVPAVVGNAVGGLLVGFIVQRTGRYKLLSILGPVSSSIGFLLLILRWHGKTNLAELMYIIPGGFGTGITQSTTFVQLTAGVKSSEIAMAGTSLYLSQNLGAVSGFSVTTFVLQSTLRSGLAKSLHAVPHRHEIIERSISNLDFVQSLEGNVKELVISAYVRSLTCTHVVALACSLLAWVVALCIREHQI